MIWLLAHPIPSTRSVSFLTDGRGEWVNLLNNGAANKKNILKSEMLPTVSCTSLNR
jgi:hypothetical protein